LQHIAELLHEWRGPLLLLAALRGPGMDQVEPEATEKELLQETGLLPLAFPRRFRDVARLLLGGQGMLRVCHGQVTAWLWCGKSHVVPRGTQTRSRTRLRAAPSTCALSPARPASPRARARSDTP